jgi:hypothetical protein
VALAQLELLPLAEVIALLGHEGALRARGLVEVTDAAALGWLLPSDVVCAGRGLHLFASGEGRESAGLYDSALFCGQAPGVGYLPAPPPGTAWAQDLLAGDRVPAALADIVRDQLAAPHAVLLWLGGLSSDSLSGLAQATRARLSRPVLTIDGAALAGWPPAQVLATLRRLRRDADLRGAVVLVGEVRALAGGWRALCQPRPPGQTAPVILSSGDALLPLGRPAEGSAGEKPLLAVSASLLRSAVAAPMVAGDGSSADDPAVLASREDARRRAALDAARAMGRPLPPELAETPRPAPVPSPPAALPPVLRPPEIAPAGPAVASRPPPAASRPAAESAPAQPPNPRLAAALAKAGLPPPGGSRQADSEPPRPPAPSAAASRPAPLPPPPAVSVPSPPAAASPPVDSSDDDQPALPLDPAAPLDELLRVARSTPNNGQRSELLKKLSGARSPAVIQLFRSNLGSLHAGVRAAAEAGMESLFGVNWNRSRPIPPPIQPPRSDDNGRGPGGAI